MKATHMTASANIDATANRFVQPGASTYGHPFPSAGSPLAGLNTGARTKTLWNKLTAITDLSGVDAYAIADAHYLGSRFCEEMLGTLQALRDRGLASSINFYSDRAFLAGYLAAEARYTPAAIAAAMNGSR